MTKHYLIKILLSAVFVFSGLWSSAQHNDIYKAKRNKQKMQNYADTLDFKKYYLAGLQEKIIKKYDDAVRSFTSCLYINPNSDESYYELANIFKHTGKYNHAIIAIDKALYINKRVEYYILRAEIQEILTKYYDAAKTYAAISLIIPNKKEFYLAQTDAYINAKKNREALGLLSKTEALFNKDKEICLRRINIYSKQHRIDSAIKISKKLIRKYPNNARFYLCLADLYKNKNAYKKTLQTYHKALKTVPEKGMVYLAISHFYLERNNPEKVFFYMKKAFLDNSLSFYAKIKELKENYSRILISPKTNDDLIELLNILNKNYPNKYEPYLLISNIFKIQGKTSYAVNMYKKAVSYIKNDSISLLTHKFNKIEVVKNLDIKHFSNYYGNLLFDPELKNISLPYKEDERKTSEYKLLNERTNDQALHN